MPGHVPDMYLTLKRRYPKTFAAAEGLGQAARAEGPLQEKHLHLIQLAAAAAIRSEGAVHSHVRRALECGAGPEEIRHALMALVSTIGLPSVVAANSWADDVLEAGKRAGRSSKRE